MVLKKRKKGKVSVEIKIINNNRNQFFGNYFLISSEIISENIGIRLNL